MRSAQEARPSDSSSEVTLVEEIEDGVLTLVLSRPEAHNALNSAMLGSLRRSLLAAYSDVSIRCIVITGSGTKAFCAGADLDELSRKSAGAAHEILGYGRAVIEIVERSHVPIIAAVNGVALGGGFELALACSFILASHNASFGLPETGLGLIPGYGGTQRLPELIGRQLALHAILTGQRLSAARAYELGLVALPPVPLEELPAVASEEASRILKRGSNAASMVLELVKPSSQSTDSTGARLETAFAAFAVASDEAAEGISAFREHRTPRF